MLFSNRIVAWLNVWWSITQYGLINIFLILILIVILMLSGVAQAVSVGNPAVISIKSTFVAPPCTLTAPDKVYLGSIHGGYQTYSPFSVQLDCSVPTNTVLYAEQVGGSLVSGRTDTINMSGPNNTGTPAQLRLIGINGAITLDGSGATDSANGFCAGVNNRTCTLTPETLVATDTPRGQTTAMLRFGVRYP